MDSSHCFLLIMRREGGRDGGGTGGEVAGFGDTLSIFISSCLFGCAPGFFLFCLFFFMVGNSCENVASKIQKKQSFLVDPECCEKAKTENQNFLDIQPNQIEQPNQCTSCTSGSAGVCVRESVCVCESVCVYLHVWVCVCVCVSMCRYKVNSLAYKLKTQNTVFCYKNM